MSHFGLFVYLMKTNLENYFYIMRNFRVGWKIFGVCGELSTKYYLEISAQHCTCLCGLDHLKICSICFIMKANLFL